MEVPPQIGTVLRRSCVDCHSNNTAWPWYSYVAPVSWLVERDVEKGRRHLNFSRWYQYTLADRSRLLADLASAVKNHEMPLTQYTLVHRRAQLSDTERDLLYQWAREERKKVRAKIIQTSSAEKPAGNP